MKDFSTINFIKYSGPVEDGDLNKADINVSSVTQEHKTSHNSEIEMYTSSE